MSWTCSIVDRPKKRLFGPNDESAFLIIVLHTSSVLVIVRASKKIKAKINSDREIIMAFFRNSGVFCRILVVFTEIEGQNKNPGHVLMLPPPWYTRREVWGRVSVTHQHQHQHTAHQQHTQRTTHNSEHAKCHRQFCFPKICPREVIT